MARAQLLAVFVEERREGGTVVGVLIIGVLRNGLNLLGVSPFIQQIVIGAVIAVAVTFDTLGRRKS